MTRAQPVHSIPGSTSSSGSTCDFSSGIPDHKWMSHGIHLVHWFNGRQLSASLWWPTAVSSPWSLRPPESGHVPRAAREPEGLPGELLDELRQRRARLHALYGQEGQCSSTTAVKAARATSWSRRKAIHAEATSDIVQGARRALRPAARADPAAAADGDRRLLTLAAHDPTGSSACARARRRTATVEEGFALLVACIMAARAYWSGRRMYWDKAREEGTLDHAPAAGEAARPCCVQAKSSSAE